MRCYLPAAKTTTRRAGKHAGRPLPPVLTAGGELPSLGAVKRPGEVGANDEPPKKTLGVTTEAS